MTEPTRVVDWQLSVEPYWRRVPGAVPLLHAIAEEPDDDTTRLVLADLCDDVGECGRAEFIRLLIDPSRFGLCREDANERAEALFAAESARWCEGLPEIDGVAWDELDNFADGLLSGLTLTIAPDDDSAATIRDAITLRRLGLHAAHGTPGPELLRLLGDVRELSIGGEIRNGVEFVECAAFFRVAGRNHLRRLRTLRITCVDDGDEAFAAVASAASLCELRELDFSHLRFTPDGLAALPTPAALGRLETLRLAPGILDAEAIRALARWSGCRRLKCLDIGHNPLRDAGAVALTGSHAFAGLETLGVTTCGIGPAGATTLGRSPTLTGLRDVRVGGNMILGEGAAALGGRLVAGADVDLNSCGMGDTVLRSLLASPSATGIESLNLQQCGITLEGVRALSAHPGLSSLRTLRLDGNPVGTGGVAALCRSPHLRRLTRLSLMRTGLSSADADGEPWSWPDTLRELDIGHEFGEPALADLLARRPVPDGLRRLAVSQTLVCAEDLRRLLAAGVPAGLRFLGLSAAQLDDESAGLLAAEPRLSALHRLYVGRCHLTSAGIGSLLASPHLRSLTHLDALSQLHPLTRSAVRTLARGACPPALRSLSLTVVPTAAAAVARLRSAPAFRGVTSLTIHGLTPTEATP